MVFHMIFMNMGSSKSGAVRTVKADSENEMNILASFSLD